MRQQQKQALPSSISLISIPAVSGASKNIVWGVIAAAGDSSRMGLSENKNKVLLSTGSNQEKTVLHLTIKSLIGANLFAGLVVVCRNCDMQFVESIVNDFSNTIQIQITGGGATRADSVKNGIAALPAEATHVAIHDGARPFVSCSEIKAVVAKGIETGAAILATPCRYTIKKVHEGRIVDSLNRSELWEAHTPQVFAKAIIEDALAQPESHFATDDASLVERLGIPVAVVPARSTNLKITTAEDLKHIC